VPGGALAEEKLILVLTDLMVLDPTWNLAVEENQKYVLKTRDIPTLINPSLPLQATEVSIPRLLHWLTLRERRDAAPQSFRTSEEALSASLVRTPFTAAVGNLSGTKPQINGNASGCTFTAKKCHLEELP
jgi:hypothetical protein